MPTDKEFQSLNQRDMLIRLDEGLKHVLEKIEDMKDDFAEHKDRIWKKVNEHDKVIAIEIGARKKGTSVWQITVSAVIVILALAQLYTIIITP